MTTSTVVKWMKERQIRTEDAASIFNVSFSTVQSALRGARLGSKTLQKIAKAMEAYDAQKLPTQIAG